MHPIYYDSWKKQILEMEVFNHAIDIKNNEQKEIFKLASELGITDSDLRIMWVKRSNEQMFKKNLYSKSPPKEGRDNKDVRVGGGGSNKNSVRYPSKKRSLKTWRKFYKLFPYYAERDKFDGKTSTKMI